MTVNAVSVSVSSTSIDERATLHFPSDEVAHEFVNCIKDAVIERIAHSERFSSIRLSSVVLRPNARMRHLGLAHAIGVIEYRQHDEPHPALGLAATIVHEMAHQLVGVTQEHNHNWTAACNALGLRYAHSEAPPITLPEHFDPNLYSIILDAIARFAAHHPNTLLTYDDTQPIPWPSGVGNYDCPLPHTSYDPCAEHWCHILEFQDAGIRWMLKNPTHFLMADEMGLGKTVQLLGYINVTHPESILVICPNNVTLVWLRHFQKFGIHDYDIGIAHPRLYLFNDVTIASYETMTRMKDVFAKKRWSLVIFDEGHYMKNPSAKRSRAGFSIRGDKLVISTGSPIVNYSDEIFPLGHYLTKNGAGEVYPQLRIFREVGAFERRYAGYGMGSERRLGRNLPELNAILRETIMLRRFKKDVLAQLPKKRRQVIEFEAEPEVKKLIEREMDLWNEATRDLSADEAQLASAIANESDVVMSDDEWAALILRLTNNRRYAFEEMSRIAHEIGKAKLPYVIEHIENALEAREKVVVFGHHRDVLETIARQFKNEGAVLAYGGNDPSENQRLALKFSEDDSCRVFVGGIKIAQGWSLKGSSTVLFIEEDWVPGDMTQAEDRAHGIGRGDVEAKSMLIQHLVFENSLDTKKAQLAIRKQKAIEKATGRV